MSTTTPSPLPLGTRAAHLLCSHSPSHVCPVDAGRSLNHYQSPPHHPRLCACSSTCAGAAPGCPRPCLERLLPREPPTGPATRHRLPAVPSRSPCGPTGPVAPQCSLTWHPGGRGCALPARPLGRWSAAPSWEVPGPSGTLPIGTPFSLLSGVEGAVYEGEASVPGFGGSGALSRPPGAGQRARRPPGSPRQGPKEQA